MSKIQGKNLYSTVVFAIALTMLIGCANKNYNRFSYNKKYKRTYLVKSNKSNDNSKKGYYYEVKKGDTLWDISKVTGVMISTIKKVNNLTNVKKLYKGAKLYIPSIKLNDAKFDWPCKGVVVSKYGKRGRRFHHGIDIAAPSGTVIRATLGGKVIYSGYNKGGYGNLIKIAHSGGKYVTYYAHNKKNFVSKGDIVKKGEIIAKVGTTGRTSGPHLHFEVRKNNKSLNPMLVLNNASSNRVRISRK